MKRILLDTGFIVALLDRSERYHAECVAALEEHGGPLVTCEAVIAESCYLLRNVAGAADAVLENVERRVFQLPSRLDETCHEVRTLMKKYARVPMDLADACLVALAAEFDTGRIYTLDSDFKIYRWRQRRSFDLLVPLNA